MEFINNNWLSYYCLSMCDDIFIVLYYV